MSKIKLSYDKKYAKNYKGKNPQIVGNSLELGTFESPAEIYDQILSMGDTCITSSIIDPDAVWCHIDKNDGRSKRPIKVNSLAFQTVIFDIDDESLNGSHVASTILNNLDFYKDKVSLIYKTPSHGTKSDGTVTGTKLGLRMMIFLDQMVHVNIHRNYFNVDQLAMYASLYVTAEEKYKLESKTKNTEYHPLLYAERDILHQVYRYYVMRIAVDLGLMSEMLPFNDMRSINIETRPKIGFDEKSFQVWQKMLGSHNKSLYIGDTKDYNYIDEAMVWIKTGMYKRDEMLKSRYNRKSTTLQVSDVMSSDADQELNFDSKTSHFIMRKMLGYLPMRTTGGGTYTAWFPLITSAKQNGLLKSDFYPLFTDKNELDNIWDNSDDTNYPIHTFIAKCSELSNRFIPETTHDDGFWNHIQDVNDRYINVDDIYNLYKAGHSNIFVNSTQNTGKTTMVSKIIHRFEGQHIIFISHLCSILKTTAERIGFDYYENTVIEEDDTLFLAITPDSLHRLNDIDLTGALVIVDEYTQVMRSMSTNYLYKRNAKYIKSMENFEKLLDVSDCNLFLDADDMIGFPETFTKKVLYRNNFKTPNMKLKMFRWSGLESEQILYDDRVAGASSSKATSSTHAFESIASTIKAGHNVAIPVSKKSTSERLYKYLTDLGLDGILLNSDAADKSESLTTIANGTAKYQFVIYTYTAWTGFDVPSDNHNVDVVIAIFESVRGLCHNDYIQAMRRFRNVKTGLVYANWTGTIKLESFHEFTQAYIDAKTSKEALMETDIYLYTCGNKFDKILKHVGHIEQVMGNYRDCKTFKDRLDPSAIISYQSNAYRPTDGTVDSLTSITELTKEERQVAFTGAKILSQQQFTELERKSKSVDEYMAMQKTILSRQIGLESAVALEALIEPKHRMYKKIPLILEYLMCNESHSDLLAYKLAQLSQKVISNHQIVDGFFNRDILIDPTKAIYKNRAAKKLISPLLNSEFAADSKDEQKLLNLSNALIKLKDINTDVDVTLKVSDTTFTDKPKTSIDVADYKVVDGKLKRNKEYTNLIRTLSSELKTYGFELNSRKVGPRGNRTTTYSLNESVYTTILKNNNAVDYKKGVIDRKLGRDDNIITFTNK